MDYILRTPSIHAHFNLPVSILVPVQYFVASLYQSYVVVVVPGRLSKHTPEYLYWMTEQYNRGRHQSLDTKGVETWL